MDQVITNLPTVVITLVHGTWSKGEWTESGSAFCRSLERLLGAKQQTVRIERFAWPGKNTTTSRAKAAYNLCWDLIDQCERYPSADHFVVGHSHGGAVALQSIAGLYVGTIAGVATLSTPFLVARPRNLGRAGWVPFWIFPLSASMLVGWYAYSSSSGLPGIARRLLAVLVAVSMTGLLERVWNRLVSQAAALRARLSYPTMLPEPLYIARAPGDEASEALASSHLIERAIVGMWYTLARPLEGLYGRPTTARDEHRADRSWGARLSPSPWATIQIALGLALILFVPRFAIVSIGLIYGAVFTLVRGPLRKGVGGTVAAVLLGAYATLLSMLSPIVATVLAACTWAEYDEFSMYTTSLDVSAESTPPGRWELTLLPDATTELAHSVYNDPRVQDGLVRWIVHTIAKRRQMKPVAEYLRQRLLDVGPRAAIELPNATNQDEPPSSPAEGTEANGTADDDLLATARALAGIWGGKAGDPDTSAMGVVVEVVPTETTVDVRLSLIVDGLAQQFAGVGHDLYRTGDLSVARLKVGSEMAKSEFDVMLAVARTDSMRAAARKDMVVSVVPIAPNVTPLSARLERQRGTSFSEETERRLWPS
jgi:hypothetical protein